MWSCGGVVVGGSRWVSIFFDVSRLFLLYLDARAARVVHVFDLVELQEYSRKAAGLDPDLADSSELRAGVIALAVSEGLMAAAKAHLVAKLDARAITLVEDGLSTATWLARETGISGTSARAQVKVANKLVSLALVDEAFVAGLLSWDHVRVIVDAASNPRVGDQIADLQAELIEMASGTVFEHWRQQVNALVQLLDVDGPEPDDLNRNRFSINKTLDGLFHLEGELTEGYGLSVYEAIEAIADEMFREAKTDRELGSDLEIPKRGVLRAKALVELCRRGLAVDLETSRPPRTEVTLIINTDTTNGAMTVSTPDGFGVRPSAIEVLLCDADFYAIVVDSLGVPVNMGRTVRRATSAQQSRSGRPPRSLVPRDPLG